MCICGRISTRKHDFTKVSRWCARLRRRDSFCNIVCAAASTRARDTPSGVTHHHLRHVGFSLKFIKGNDIIQNFKQYNEYKPSIRINTQCVHKYDDNSLFSLELNLMWARSGKRLGSRTICIMCLRTLSTTLMRSWTGLSLTASSPVSYQQGSFKGTYGVSKEFLCCRNRYMELLSLNWNCCKMMWQK